MYARKLPSAQTKLEIMHFEIMQYYPATKYVYHHFNEGAYVACVYNYKQIVFNALIYVVD